VRCWQQRQDPAARWLGYSAPLRSARLLRWWSRGLPELSRLMCRLMVLPPGFRPCPGGRVIAVAKYGRDTTMRADSRPGRIVAALARSGGQAASDRTRLAGQRGFPRRLGAALARSDAPEPAWCPARGRTAAPAWPGSVAGIRVPGPQLDDGDLLPEDLLPGERRRPDLAGILAVAGAGLAVAVVVAASLALSFLFNAAGRDTPAPVSPASTLIMPRHPLSPARPAGPFELCDGEQVVQCATRTPKTETEVMMFPENLAWRWDMVRVGTVSQSVRWPFPGASGLDRRYSGDPTVLLELNASQDRCITGTGNDGQVTVMPCREGTVSAGFGDVSDYYVIAGSTLISVSATTALGANTAKGDVSVLTASGTNVLDQSTTTTSGTQDWQCLTATTQDCPPGQGNPLFLSTLTPAAGGSGQAPEPGDLEMNDLAYPHSLGFADACNVPEATYTFSPSYRQFTAEVGVADGASAGDQGTQVTFEVDQGGPSPDNPDPTPLGSVSARYGQPESMTVAIPQGASQITLVVSSGCLNDAVAVWGNARLLRADRS
jgi:NPCBM/NEW2 domain